MDRECRVGVLEIRGVVGVKLVGVVGVWRRSGVVL